VSKGSRKRLVSVMLRLEPAVYRRLMVRAAHEGLTPMKYIRARIYEEDRAAKPASA